MKNQVLWMIVMAAGMGYNATSAVQAAQQNNWGWMGVYLLFALGCAVFVVSYVKVLFGQPKANTEGERP